MHLISTGTAAVFSLTSTYLTFNAEDETHVSASVTMLRRANVAESVILSGVKSHLRSEIDAAAERARMRYVTPGAGQMAEYQEVQAEAMAVLSSHEASAAATPAGYPMLAASVGRDIDPKTGERATDIAGAARAVRASYGQWLKVGAEIRRWRLASKDRIAAATTIEDAVVAASVEPLEVPS